jgi:hypothetical protein
MLGAGHLSRLNVACVSWRPAPRSYRQLIAKKKDGGLELPIEGVMAKRRDSIYGPGVRSPDWAKIKRPGWQVGRNWRSCTATREKPPPGPETFRSCRRCRLLLQSARNEIPDRIGGRGRRGCRAAVPAQNRTGLAVPIIVSSQAGRALRPRVVLPQLALSAAGMVARAAGFTVTSGVWHPSGLKSGHFNHTRALAQPCNEQA